jgi:Zn-dependent protease
LLGLLQREPLVFFLLAIGLVGAISIHEYGHALAADLQGDRLPRAMGRLTLNPVRHLDPLGTLCLLLVGFGWGKPVEFRHQALSSKRFGAAIVALAGPAMNLLLALATALVIVATDTESVAATEVSAFQLFLRLFFGTNVLLAVFNLIPLPPLDGSRLLTIFLPPSKQRIIFFLDQYGFLILLALVFFGGIELFGPIISWTGRAILSLAGA